MLQAMKTKCIVSDLNVIDRDICIQNGVQLMVILVCIK